jgi:hypothetical protein
MAIVVYSVARDSSRAAMRHFREYLDTVAYHSRSASYMTVFWYLQGKECYIVDSSQKDAEMHRIGRAGGSL